MTEVRGELPVLRAGGTPREVGRALGRAGHDAVHAHLLRCEFWRSVTGSANAALVARLMAATRARFPRIWEELEGLAEGLGLPLAQVFAWNCRGDILASAPDGCTTVMVPGPTPVLAHNEDGLPFFSGHCFLADVAPEEQPGFLSFCYPGSIPGHTFAATRAGLVQTVNNIRLLAVDAGIPRMVLGRAVLAAETLDDAVGVLRDGAQSGGFHFGLAHRDDRRILSVEFGRGAVSVAEVTTPAVHANHAVHADARLGPQIVTRSSADRQARAEVLLASRSDPLEILRDIGGPSLPIRRDAPDDPDDENTMATAVFELADGAISWTVHPPAGQPTEGMIA